MLYWNYKRVDLLIMSENGVNTEKKRWNFWERYRKSFLLVLFGAFIWAGYEKQLVELYDDTIVSLLSKINDGCAFMIVTCISLALLAGFLLYKSCKCYLDTVPRIILILSLTVIYTYYRSKDAYVYYPEGWWIKYLDILFLILFMYALCQIGLNICIKRKYRKPKNDDFIPGQAIAEENEDVLKFWNSAKNVTERLEKIPPRVSFSIGINSSWGDGKSSYLNFICKHIEDSKKYILINFNPAESKGEDLIQVDFFEQIKSALRGYNGELSSLIDNYMKAIGIVDESNFISKVRNLKETFYDDNEKAKLRAALKKIRKRVVVIIDDIDRLTPEEALKTIKLVRYTAYNISDIIFITAYDRDCINQLTKNKKGEDLSLFWDKFFDMEIQLPYRHYSYIISYMGEQLQKWFNELKSAPFEKVMNDLGDDFILFIRNLRDAKRFLNAFYMEYLDVRGEVVFEHFFYVRLLKYRYTDIYYALRAKEYIASKYIDGTGDYTKGEYHLEKGFENNLGDCDEKDKKAIKKVLNLLFPENLKLDDIRPIYDCASFETYFLDGISNVLSLESIKSLLGKSVQDAKLQIDEWVKSGYLYELMYFLGRCRESKFDKQRSLELNVQLAFYLLKHTSNSNYCIALKDYLCLEKVKPLLEKFSVNEQQYKDFLRKLFTGDSQGKYIYNDFIRWKLEERYPTTANDTLIFNNEELLDYAKRGLSNYLENDILRAHENSFLKGLSLLYSCVQKKVGDDLFILDEAACLKMKEYIESHPESFIYYFVFSIEEEEGIFKFSPRARYESIFGSKEEFEKFLMEEKLNQIQRIDLARNFWELFKSNDYVSILSRKEIDVQKIINGNFYLEVLKLHRIQEIQKKVATYFNNFRGTHDRKVKALSETKELKQEFDGIASKMNLNIKLIQETGKLFDPLIKKLNQQLNLPA